MGGGGGGGPSARDLRQLETLAKRALQEAAARARRNIFISFAHEDINEVNLLRGQAKNENSELEFSDWSLREPFDSDRAEYVRRGIQERVRQASVTLVYLSEHTADSKWVDWEVKESLRQGKGVIGVYQGASPPAKLPPAVVENRIKLVQWTHEGIARSIEEAASGR